jgi:DNA polymerase III delta subunit
MDNGENPGALFKRFGIWSSRSGIVNSALSRLSRVQWESILRRIGRVDMMVKGIVPLQRRDIWEEIESISLSICNPGNQRHSNATA